MLDASHARNTDTLHRNADNTSKSPKDASQSLQTKRCRDVKIEDCELTELVDTGSELTLMRTKFRDIGSESNCTAGQFSTNVVIDDVKYVIMAHIVSNTLMQYSLIIGTDFLITIEINIKDGDISIDKIDGKDYNRFPKVSKIEKK